MKLVVALLSMCIMLQGAEETPTVKKVVQISIPKCGTHLLSKCLHLLGKTRSSKKIFAYTLPIRDFANVMSLPDGRFWMGHLIYKAEYAELIRTKNYAPIFIYRDPRDHVVSYAYYMKKMANHYIKAGEMDIRTIISDQLTRGLTYGVNSSFTNVDGVYKIYLPWASLPNMLCIRFEDLVGAHGGGSDEAQSRTIKQIAEHIGIELTNEKLLEVQQNLFGKTNTFREGQIGSWKSHFTPRQKELFKKLAGQLLIDLGYEKDFNW